MVTLSGWTGGFSSLGLTFLAYCHILCVLGHTLGLNSVNDVPLFRIFLVNSKFLKYSRALLWQGGDVPDLDIMSQKYYKLFLKIWALHRELGYNTNCYYVDLNSNGVNIPPET